MKHVDHGYDLELIGALKELADSCSRTRPIHFQPQGDYLLDNVRYHSRPEAACGYLLSKYCRDFELVPGRTFQVPVGVGSGGDLQTVDFKHGEIYIEYHPPRIHQHATRRRAGRREPRELRKLRAKLKAPNLPRRVRDQHYERLRHYLTRRYVEQRMQILSDSPIIGDFTLMVLSSPEELYHDFLRVHATDWLPRASAFAQEFKQLLKEVIDLRKS